MAVYLRFYEYYVDEENDKVMFNVLVCELFAFVLNSVRVDVQGESTH